MNLKMSSAKWRTFYFDLGECVYPINQVVADSKFKYVLEIKDVQGRRYLKFRYDCNPRLRLWNGGHFIST